MTNSTQQEIARLMHELAAIYRLGKLTPAEEIKTEGLWARIERLQNADVAARVKEQKIFVAAQAAAKVREDVDHDGV